MEKNETKVRLGREEIPEGETQLRRGTIEAPLISRSSSQGSLASGVTVTYKENTSPAQTERTQTDRENRNILAGRVIPRNQDNGSTQNQSNTGTRENRDQNTPPPLPSQRPPVSSRLSGQANRKISGFAKGLVNRLTEDIEKGNGTAAFYILVFCAALKDIMDAGQDTVLLIIQAIPIIGQVTGVVAEILWAGLSLLVSTILYFFMLSQGWLGKQKLKILHWLLTSIEIIPILGIMPWQTISVIIVFNDIKKRAERARAKIEKVRKMSERELKEFDTNYDKELDEE